MLSPFLPTIKSIQNISRLYLLIHIALCKIHRLNQKFMKKYFSERNALTVMVSLFCFVMMLIAFFKDQSIWQGIAFALAFSFSVEVIQHRAKEQR